MRRRAKSAKGKAAAKRPHTRKARTRESPRTRDLEKRLAEALEQQTATADILRVISSSPTDTQPVFDAIAERTARLCEANDVMIRRIDGDVMIAVAHVGPVPVPENIRVVRVTRGSIGGRALLERRMIQVADV